MFKGTKVLKQTIETEGYYVQNENGVFFYWRVVGTPTWNVHLTGLNKLPYIEHLATPKIESREEKDG